MELLGALEEKIRQLVERVKELQSQKSNLEAESKLSLEKIEQLERALLKKDEDYREWDKERSSARKAVDELIADIDSLIEGGTGNG